MRILVLGGGTVGSSIAELLCRHGHHVTVVDEDVTRTRYLNDVLDVGVVAGSASESPILFQAGVLGAELCLAVTGSDEVNLIAASLAKSMGCRRSVARVYSPAYRDVSTFDYCRHFGIDRLLSLEHLSAMEFASGIRNPGSLAVESLARGEIEVQQIEALDGSKGLATALRQLKLPTEVRIGFYLSRRQDLDRRRQDEVLAGDMITVIGRRGAIDGVRSMFQKQKSPMRHIAIAGGGETGFNLARVLEGLRFSVTLIEYNTQRCEFLASNLKSATVVQANATHRSALEEERVATADTFIACLGADEENIMACVEAREIGAGQVMAIVSRPDYAQIVGKLGIDLAVSPREVMAKQVLSFLNTGPIVSRINLANSPICVLEMEVVEGCPITHQTLSEITFPPQCLIAAIARVGQVKVPTAKDRFKPGDTAVALVAEPSVHALLPLFTPDRH